VDVSPEATLETVACRLCGSPRSRHMHSGPDYFMRLPGVFHLVRCEECSLLYQNPRPPLAEIGRYYPDHYGSYGSAQAGLRTRSGLMGRIIRRGMNKRCHFLDRAVPARAGRPRRHLDVGCASGLFMEAMQGHGWQVEGVELNETAARTTSARLGVPVFTGPFEEAHYPDASFDAVTMWDVLEHFHDPLASLRELRRIVRPGGALFVRVPNAASYVARLCGRYWVGYDLPRHMTVFTPKTLRRALTQAGFEQIVHAYTSGSYLVLLHSLRFAMDDSRVSPQRAAAIHRVLLHPVMRALVWVPFRLADQLASGSTLEVLAR
jgi:2-polyprenyl-3-methyl-5-hydroxy-6-metoxy-1,4-benzoquinol methylase